MPSNLPFLPESPTPNQTVGEMLAAIKLNAQNVRNYLVPLGLQGFNYSVNYGTNEFPVAELFTSGSEVIEIDTNYTTTPSGNYLPLTKWIIAPSAGILDNDLWRVDFSYDADDILTAATWVSGYT